LNELKYQVGMITERATRILPKVPAKEYVSVEAKQSVESMKRHTVNATIVLKRCCLVLES